jgi:RNA-directed DNA polymerase
MKRIGFIYNKICSLDNILLAIEKASKGKKDKREVKYVLDNLLECAENVKSILENKSYIPSKYNIMLIKDGANKKERTIYKPKFYPDQIIHWALMLQIQPIIEKGMYQYCCGSVPNRGVHYAHNKLINILKKDKKNTKYCLQIDIKKFYPSVSNNIIISMFERKIKDKNCIWLISQIVNSAQGLPIGTYTSQWFANFYLEGLDHYIKETLKAKYYIRYVDDIIILGANKRKLHKTKLLLCEYLNSIGLSVKDNWQIYPIKYRAIDFLGFRYYKNKTTLRRRNYLRIKRRYSKINKKLHLNIYDARAVVSYWGWIKSSDSYMLYNKIKGKTTIKSAKSVISKYNKRRNIS